MEQMRLGRTDITVGRTGFGAIPIQRISFDEAKYLLQKAYNNGVTFFDTARMYSDSEEKIGYAFSEIRKDIIIATKSMAKDAKTLNEQLETSLRNLKTDYIDIYQLHNPEFEPGTEKHEELYQAVAAAKKAGKIRFIGITNHRRSIAKKAVESGLYDTLQFPLCLLSTPEDLELISLCKDRDVGVIAMKALSGGLITDARAAFAFLRQYENVVPIWGIQKESELDEILSYEVNPPKLDEETLQTIGKYRKELSGDFCRGCGYCLPCPAGIDIPNAARMSFLLVRARYQDFMTESRKENMDKINDCIDCGHCRNNCPYKLDTPVLLKQMYKSYTEFYNKYHKPD